MPIPDSTSYSSFRQNLAGHFKRLKKADRPTVVLQRGKPAAVVVHPDMWDEREADADLGRLIRSIDEADAGNHVDAFTALRKLERKYERAAKTRSRGKRKSGRA